MFANPRRRRRVVADDEDDEEGTRQDIENDNNQAARRVRPRQSNGRSAQARGEKRSRGDNDDEQEEEEDENDGAGEGNEGQNGNNGGGYSDEEMNERERSASNYAQLVKKLVRYAIACEFSRKPIRRDGIKEKVLGPDSRLFRKVMSGAQRHLAMTFGMRMVELPARSQATMTAEQKRKAARWQRDALPASSGNTYVLKTMLPDRLRNAAIMDPSAVQSPEAEAAYVGVYTALISIITLSGGELSDPRLRRYLRRLNADNTMPSGATAAYGEAVGVDRTDVVLQRLARQGYLVRVPGSVPGDEDSVFWHIGPRSTVEVGPEAVASIIRCVYGGSSDELEKRLHVSLDIKDWKDPTVDSGVDMGGGGVGAGEGSGSGSANEDGEENGVHNAPNGEQEEPSVNGNARRSRRRGRNNQHRGDDDDDG